MEYILRMTWESLRGQITNLLPKFHKSETVGVNPGSAWTKSCCRWLWSNQPRIHTLADICNHWFYIQLMRQNLKYFVWLISKADYLNWKICWSDLSVELPLGFRCWTRAFHAAESIFFFFLVKTKLLKTFQWKHIKVTNNESKDLGGKGNTFLKCIFQELFIHFLLLKVNDLSYQNGFISTEEAIRIYLTAEDKCHPYNLVGASSQGEKVPCFCAVMYVM